MTPGRRRWFLSRAAKWIAVACFAATLFVYLQTLAPSLVRGDGGEFQYNLATLGVSHPTGYPLYTLVGWVWAKVVPVGTVAWRINLLSAVFGAAAVALTYAIVCRLTGRVLPSLAGACFLALSPTFWSLSSAAEVYSLHALFVAALLYLALVWRDAPSQRGRVLLLIAFVFGLSLSHHRTTILLAPAVAVFLLLETLRPLKSVRGAEAARRASWAATPQSAEPSPREPATDDPERSEGKQSPHPEGRVPHWLVFVAVFLAGLLPYLHTFIHGLLNGRTLHQILFHTILGGNFLGFLGFRSDPLRVLWDLPRQQIGIIGLLAVAVGLAWLIRKQWRTACLLGGSFALTVLFCLFYRVPDIQDFIVPATMVLSIWAGTGGAVLGALLEKMLPLGHSGKQQSWLRLGRLLVEGGILVVALLGLRNLSQVEADVQGRAGDVEERARALLAFPFESGAAVVTDWELTTAVKFLTEVEGIEAHIQIMPARLWYEEACSDLLEIASSGRAIYVAPEVQISRLPAGYRLSTAPPYLRITREPVFYTSLNRPIAPQLTLEGVQKEGRMLVLRWLVNGPALPQDYTTYVHFFDGNGQAIGQTDKGIGREATCWYPPTAWPVGQVTQDLFVIPAETAKIRTGLYVLHEGTIEQFGTDLVIELKP